jgi:histidyl-tRNA synthetase
MADAKISLSPKGMNDVLPKDHDYLTFLKKVVRHRCRQAGFKRISTPMFEKTEVVKKALAEEADQVERRMYSLRDPEGEDLTLRAGNTIGIARAYVEHEFDEMPQPISLYHFEQQARYTDVKSGYYRHFHQFGMEVIGQNDAALDAQVIYLADKINKDLKIEDRLELRINSYGDGESKEEYIAALKDFFKGKERAVPMEYVDLIDRDPLQLFLTEDEDLKILCEMAPKIQDYWSDESKQYFSDLQEYLDELGIEYIVDHKMFRRLPYYSGVIFEFWEKNRGRKRAVGGGGRYDNLIERLGDKPVPAVHYVGGVERTVAQMKIKKVKAPSKDDLHVFVAQLGKKAKVKCLKLLTQMHDEGIKAIGAIGESSMKDQIAMATSFKAPYMILIGITEVRDGVAIIREMKKGTQKKVPLDMVIPEMIKRIGEENLDKYSPGELLG